jgi:hypothetical protein
LGYILGDFFTNSSGHPDCNADFQNATHQNANIQTDNFDFFNLPPNTLVGFDLTTPSFSLIGGRKKQYRAARANVDLGYIFVH